LNRGCEVIEVDCSCTLLEKVQAFDSYLIKLLAPLATAAAVLLTTTMIVAYLDLIDEIFLRSFILLSCYDLIEAQLLQEGVPISFLIFSFHVDRSESWY